MSRRWSPDNGTHEAIRNEGVPNAAFRADYLGDLAEKTNVEFYPHERGGYVVDGERYLTLDGAQNALEKLANE